MDKTFFIIEDHSLMRHGIVSWITEKSDWKCLGMAQDIDSAKKALNELFSQNNILPSILITDITLDSKNYDYSGLEVIKEVEKLYPSIRCICFSMHSNPGIIHIALDNGAKGYISKTATEEELLKCMDAVLNGEVYIENNLYTSITIYMKSIASLTKREKAVVELIIKHKSNDEIASLLGIQKRAVESYTSRIYDKMGCSNRNDLLFALN